MAETKSDEAQARERSRYLRPDADHVAFVAWLEARVLELQRERDLLLFEPSNSQHSRELEAREREADALRARIATLEHELREGDLADMSRPELETESEIYEAIAAEYDVLASAHSRLGELHGKLAVLSEREAEEAEAERLELATLAEAEVESLELDGRLKRARQ